MDIKQLFCSIPLKNGSILTQDGKIPKVKLSLKNIVRYYKKFRSDSTTNTVLPERTLLKTKLKISLMNS